MTWRVAVLVCSDSRAGGDQMDPSAQVIRELVEEELNGTIVDIRFVPDDRMIIRASLMELADDVDADLIFTTGGIGLQLRDVTPEATMDVIDQQVPGIAEAMRAASLTKSRKSMFTRGMAGLRREVLIINLPGSPKVAFASLNAIMDDLPYALSKLQARKQAIQALLAGKHKN
jgi:molybdopterin adenylyltransferase